MNLELIEPYAEYLIFVVIVLSGLYLRTYLKERAKMNQILSFIRILLWMK